MWGKTNFTGQTTIQLMTPDYDHINISWPGNKPLSERMMVSLLGPLSLTWFNLNPSMDK